jgi:hypothetical protein
VALPRLRCLRRHPVPILPLFVLASGAPNGAGERLSIELHQPADSPSFVMVVGRSSPLSPHPYPKH